MALEVNAFRHFSDAEVAAVFTWAKAGFSTSNRVIKVAGSGDVTVDEEWFVDRDSFWAALNARLDKMTTYAASKPITRTSFRYI